jgi:hypothetical protein
VLTAFRRDLEARVLLTACDGDVAEVIGWLKRLLSPEEVWRQRQELGVSLAEAGREVEVEGERIPLGTTWLSSTTPRHGPCWWR